MSKKVVPERIIMGVDPGTNLTGYGVIRVQGNQAELITYGIIDLRKIQNDHPLKLKRIFERTLSLVEEFTPDEFAIEAPFFGKNVQSMLKLGRAQGVAMAAALHRSVPIFEYAPKKIKMALTGSGAASKEQVLAMVQNILHFEFDRQQGTLDASDGLAVAVTHFLQKGVGAGQGGSKKISKGSGGGWESFVKNNPSRLK